MGSHRHSKRRSSQKTSSDSSVSSSDKESPEPRQRRSTRHGESSRGPRSRKREQEKGKRRERSRKRRDRRRRRSDNESSDQGVSKAHDDPQAILRLILSSFPDVADDLKQLLQMIDNGQGVDVRGISNKSLVKHLKKLFWSLKLKENDTGVFILPSKGTPFDIIGSTVWSDFKSRDNHLSTPRSLIEQPPAPSNTECMKSKDDPNAKLLTKGDVQETPSSPPRRRLIGPEMPSRELLAAAAELTEAETLLREADLEVDNDLFIGPPPPAVVAEAESANEAERFEEVARIVGAEVDKPYDVLGVNWKMSSDNIKKRYWKLSLMVHPDKCSHPQAHQAFVLLNQAFKDLQDTDKRKNIDEKIKLKEEQEEFMAELKSLREAAQWRRLQGISKEGDDELLAIAKEAPKRDEWMTELPPERKQGMSMQSTSFSRTAKEGRGDTSVWTDSPLDKAEKAKQTYLEAYDKAKSLADADERKKGSSDADLVDKYNSLKRAKSLVQKHQEESRKPKKKAKQLEKQEWEGEHPWKPWDREKDLEAGRIKVNLDSEGMAQGLTSRFSSGTMQRNFL